MSPGRKVLVLEEGDGAVDVTRLVQALQALGAVVRRQRLDAPGAPLLDALADGWLPVVMGAARPTPAAPPS
ncbi:MAG: hypothetical protein KGL78_06780 [Burkholderiales bacterium]|nr:hypothetical protein [Burkholderiales bacterium]